MKIHFTRTVLKDIGIGAIVDDVWRIESYSHTGRNAIGVKCDSTGKPAAPFTRVVLIQSVDAPIIGEEK